MTTAVWVWAVAGSCADWSSFNRVTTVRASSSLYSGNNINVRDKFEQTLTSYTGLFG